MQQNNRRKFLPCNCLKSSSVTTCGRWRRHKLTLERAAEGTKYKYNDHWTAIYSLIWNFPQAKPQQVNQSFHRGTSIATSVQAGKCLNLARGQSPPPLTGTGDSDMEKVPTCTAGDPNPGPSAHRWPGFGSPLNERWSHQKWPPDFLEIRLRADSGGNMHLLVLAAPGIFPENSNSKIHVELHQFTVKESRKTSVITQNEKRDLLTGLSIFHLHFSFYSVKVL